MSASSARSSPSAFAGREPLLVAPLKSSVVFLADLSRALPIPHAVDFLELAAYAGGAAAACGCSRISTRPSSAGTCSSSRTSSTPA